LGNLPPAGLEQRAGLEIGGVFGVFFSPDTGAAGLRQIAGLGAVKKREMLVWHLFHWTVKCRIFTLGRFGSIEMNSGAIVLFTRQVD